MSTLDELRTEVAAAVAWVTAAPCYGAEDVRRWLSHKDSHFHKQADAALSVLMERTGLSREDIEGLMRRKANPHIGSSLDDFLRGEMNQP